MNLKPFLALACVCASGLSITAAEAAQPATAKQATSAKAPKLSAFKWYTTKAEALAAAQKYNVPVFVVFTAEDCTYCKKLEKEILASSAFKKEVKGKAVGLMFKKKSLRTPWTGDAADCQQWLIMRTTPGLAIVAPNGERMEPCGYRAEKKPKEYTERIQLCNDSLRQAAQPDAETSDGAAAE